MKSVSIGLTTRNNRKVRFTLTLGPKNTKATYMLVDYKKAISLSTNADGEFELQESNNNGLLAFQLHEDFDDIFNKWTSMFMNDDATLRTLRSYVESTVAKVQTVAVL